MGGLKGGRTAILRGGEQPWTDFELKATFYCLYIVIQCLSRVNKFPDWYVLRLNSTTSCAWDAHISAHCISRWFELHHSSPFPCGLLLADIQNHLKACKEKLCRSNKNIQINIHIFYWSNTKRSLKREGIKIVSGNRIT